MNFIKIKDPCSLTNTKKIKIQAIFWEIMLTNYLSSREFASRIDEECKKLNKEKKQRTKQWKETRMQR